MRSKKVISAVLVVGILAAAAGFAWYTQKHEQKEQLAFATFAPQFEKVEDLRQRFNGQLKIKFAAENTPEQQREDLTDIIDNHMDAISAHILDSVLETYTTEELKMKMDFESGEYMEKLMNANSEINVAIKVYAQHLNRLGTLEALRDNFDQEKDADNLREIIIKLSNDAVTPDTERLSMIAEELNIPQQQATPVLILLALSKQAVEMQNHYLNPDFSDKDAEYVAAAKRYVELNQLNTMLENNDNFLADAEDADFAKINEQLKDILAAVVMKHIDHETIDLLNAYFETPAAQAILQKDVELAGRMGPEIKAMIEDMQLALQEQFELQETAQKVEQAEEVVEQAEEQAEEALDDIKDAVEEATEENKEAK